MEQLSWRHPDPRGGGATACKRGGGGAASGRVWCRHPRRARGLVNDPSPGRSDPHTCADDGRVNLELLVTPDCPHLEPAAVLVRSALDDVGLTTAQLSTTLITTAEEANRLGFIGSPTILVNGQDLFAVPGAQPALACRIYSGPAGPTGIPARRDLRQALKRAAAAVR
jgi:hypothetical protein